MTNANNSNNSSNSVFTSARPSPIGDSYLIKESDTIISKNAVSMIGYAQLRPHFLTGEPKFTSDGKRIVWELDTTLKDGDTVTDVRYEISVINVDSLDFRFTFTDKDEEVSIPREINLKQVAKLKSVIGCGIVSSENVLKGKHFASIRGLLGGDNDELLIGSSTTDNNINFSWADILFVLMTKGAGRGRKASYFKIECDLSTFNKILSHPDFKGIVKQYVKPVKADDKNDDTETEADILASA